MTTAEQDRPPYTPEGSKEAGDLLCTSCRWTFAMICPECPGCGCFNGQCDGWRHREYASDDEDGDQPGDFCPEDCEGCDDCSYYGLAYDQVGW